MRNGEEVVKITRKIGLILLLFGIAYSFYGCSFADSKDETQKYGYYSYSDYLKVNENEKSINKLWERSITELSSCPLIYYNNDIIAVGDYIIRVSKDGKEKWETINPINDFLCITPFVNDGILWFLSEKIYGYDVETGKLIVEEKIDNWNIESHDSCYYNGNLYMLASNRQEPAKYYKLIEWNIKDKKVTRTFRLPETDYLVNWSSVLISDGIAYFGSPFLEKEDRAGILMGLDIKEWKELWRYELPKGKVKDELGTTYVSAIDSRMLELDEKVIFPTCNGLIALNKKTGEKIWSTIAPFDKSYLEGASSARSKTLIFDRNKKRIYMETNRWDYNSNGKIDPENGEENIFCIDAETGKKIWARGTGLSEDLRAPELYNGYLYIPVDNGMCVVNADTGAKVAGLAFEDVGQTAWVVGFIDNVGYLFEANSLIGFKPYK